MALWFAEVADVDAPRWLAAAERWLTAAELERAARRRGAARLQHTVGRALARLAVASAESVPTAEVALDDDPDGGVHVRSPSGGDGAGLRLSIAHADGLIAVAAARGVAVGVDVEAEPPARGADQPVRGAGERERMLRLARRYFEAGEAESIACARPDRARAELLRYWTVKEAIGKALGVGMPPALRGAVLAADANGQLVPRSLPDGSDPAGWTVIELRLGAAQTPAAIAVPRAGVALGELNAVDCARLAAGAMGQGS